MAAPVTATSELFTSRPVQADTSARDIPISGVIRGAINIAPITTAVESVRTPNDAITEAKPISA